MLLLQEETERYQKATQIFALVAQRTEAYNDRVTETTNPFF